MVSRLRDVVVLQHRRLLTVIDRAESSPHSRAIRRVERSLAAHLDAEEAIVYPLTEPLLESARYGHEEHVVLRFALDRIRAAGTSLERSTRLRVLRDLFVHHTEREEWVTLQMLETRVPPAKLATVAKKLEAFLAPAPQTTRRKAR